MSTSPAGNIVVSPDLVCPNCGSEDVEDGEDPTWADWSTVDATFHCKPCGTVICARYVLVQWERQ